MGGGRGFIKQLVLARQPFWEAPTPPRVDKKGSHCVVREYPDPRHIPASIHFVWRLYPFLGVKIDGADCFVRSGPDPSQRRQQGGDPPTRCNPRRTPAVGSSRSLPRPASSSGPPPPTDPLAPCRSFKTHFSINYCFLKQIKCHQIFGKFPLVSKHNSNIALNIFL